MNMAMVVYSHYSRDARVRRYAEALARKGYKIDCISLKENYRPNESNITLIHYLIPRLRVGRFWYVAEYIFFFLYSTWVLTLGHITKRYEVIHINNMPDILVFTAVLPKLLGAKIILDMHDPMPELYMSKYHVDKNNLAVKILVLLENISFTFADVIITANEAFKNLFLKRNKLIKYKINVILNCPDPSIFRVNRKTKGSKNFTLFYMGTVEERFGLDMVLESLPKLVKQIPNLKFIIIPKLKKEGEYFNSLKGKIADFALSKYVEIGAPVSLEEIAIRLREADIGIVLAKNGVFTDNIFPVKLLEFIQMNIPVIATKTKILKKYFSQQQIYFLSNNSTEELVKAILTLYQSGELRHSLARNSKKYLRKNNWSNEERKYLLQIRELKFGD